MRDSKWLENQLQFLLKTYFPDVELSNPVEIKWGREAKYRFGSIKLYEPTLPPSPRAAGVRFGSIRLVKPKVLSRLRELGRLTPNSPTSLKLRRAGKLPASPTGRQIPNSRNVPKKSVITITSIFKDERIPQEVIDHTIAHELCHYVHGFSSVNRRMFRFPHHGGVINQELKRRGALHLIVAYKKWLKGYRASILAHRSSFD